jgi:hypothetical protein
MHSGETRQYLACLHNCPSIRVVDDKQCKEVAIDADQYHCSTAHAQRFDPTVGIVFIIIGVLAMFAIAASTSQSSQTQ